MSEYNKDFLKKEPPLDWHGAPEAVVVLPEPDEGPELTRIPLSRAIFKLAWPAFTSMLLLMIFNLVDIWWVGKLGAEALAGVSAAAFMMWTLQSIATLVDTGVNAMVARFYGARDNELASRVVGQGIILASILAITFGILGYIFQNYIYAYMGLEGNVLHAARDYMNFIFAGMITIFTTFAADAAFRGMGDTKTPLKIISVALLLNFILDPLLIFGIGPFPRMETGGAALATVLSHVLAISWSVWLLRKREVTIKFVTRMKQFINLDLIWRIARVGAPISFSGIMFSISYMLLTRVITRFGSEPLAALGLGHRIEGLAYFTAVGFSVAAATLVGQNLGAKKPERAEKAAWLSVLYTCCLLLAVSLVFLFFGKWIIMFFINDPRVIAEGVRYLRIIAMFEVFLGMEIVFEGAFGGAGNSLPPMLVSVPITWARIPLAIVLANTLGMGSNGIWWAIAATTGLKGIIMALWFRRGGWKTKKV
ncbi:MAG TPA: MATE family efflux transporter [bacterium]|nr:MATE family efflux transporter [bacterium]HPN44573.1 MATE family efflux transporter [bacterium]